MADLTFYTNPMSRGRIVRWMLEEVGAPYETVLLDYAGAMKTPEFLAVNPMGKVPAIVHEGRVVTEGAAICAYLADAFPDADLAPRDDAERAAYYRWMFFAAGPVEAAMTDKSLGVVVPADKKAMVGYGDLDLVADALEQAVTAHEYIAGDRFTAADVYAGSAVQWGTMFGTFAMRPAYQAYLDRVSGRPAAIKARAVDDALMPKEETA